MSGGQRGAAPAVALFNRQRAVALDLARLRVLATSAAARCLDHAGSAEALLGRLGEVEISVVSDRVIAQVHRRFLNVPGSTDVITFGHGEIVLSATTAVRQAQENSEDCNREVARYIIHGLLHLNGHEDTTPAAADEMWRAQEMILQSVWPLDDAP